MKKQKRPPLPLDASPQEKYDNLILTVFEEWQNHIGEKIQFGNGSYLLGETGKGLEDKIEPTQMGFYNLDEMIFYLGAMMEQGHLIGFAIGGKQYKDEYYKETPYKIKLSFSGLNYCRSLLESGKNSTRCFVAMKFSGDMINFYAEGIAKAIEDNGFRPIRVDKEHTENEQTINDFIIASIKQSRFCVADLTHKSHGAYFEAGYALGRGLTVIYTCRDDHFEEIHFDLKNMQIIKYATPEELREALDWKIKAVIKE